MITKKQEKNKGKFVCAECDFVCYYNSEYTRHLLTAKHKMITMITKKQEKNKKAFMCSCGREYKYASGLSRHKMACKFEENVMTPILLDDCEITSHSNETSDYKNLFLQSMEQNKELMNLIASQSKVIKDVIPKVGNTINNTTNNHFNLNVFLNEDCKDALNFSEFIDTIKISYADLENQSSVGYIKGISKLFIENLQELGTHKRPIHCTDKKRNTIYIKENNQWDKEGSQDSLKKGIREVTRKTQEKLLEEKEINSEEYKDSDSEFFEKCIAIQRSLIPNAPRDTTINKVIENISKTSGIVER